MYFVRKTNLFLIVLTAVIITAFIASVLYAAEVIKMENKAYKKHKKPVVEFKHKLHAEDYAKKNPDLFANGCGECHHDENNKPLLSLKSFIKFQSCIACHKEPGTKPSSKKLSKSDKVKKYHAEAIHAKCKGCHKNYNKNKGLRAKDKASAPMYCTKCHKK